MLVPKGLKQNGSNASNFLSYIRYIPFNRRSTVKSQAIMLKNTQDRNQMHSSRSTCKCIQAFVCDCVWCSSRRGKAIAMAIAMA